MKKVACLMAMICCVLAPVAAIADQSEPTIEGNYIEVRSCDVYIGSCFANGEVNTIGKEAIMTWAVTQGSWAGVELDGLNVIAVVRASATLGDVAHSPYPARSVLIVDQRASLAQKTALIDMAKALGGKLVEDVVLVKSSPINVAVNTGAAEGGATVSAEGLVDITSRSLRESDKQCANDKAYYPPLTSIRNAVPHATERAAYHGEGLGIRWDDAYRNSTYIGTFAR